MRCRVYVHRMGYDQVAYLLQAILTLGLDPLAHAAYQLQASRLALFLGLFLGFKHVILVVYSLSKMDTLREELSTLIQRVLSLHLLK